MSVETLQTALDIECQFELVKLDYARLAAQEQRLMDKRGEHWTKFFTITGLPVTAFGVVGVPGTIYLLALVPLFLTCIALEIKHDEQVLRYDVRKQMKKLAAAWGYANHDSKFSTQDEHQHKRFWHGYYKHSRTAAFLMAEVVASGIIAWYFTSVPVYGLTLDVGLAILNAVLIVFTTWCMF
jgi:hypothetical protein